jgi:hypothetical protein
LPRGQNLNYGGENLKYYLTPSPAVLPSWEGSADNQFKWDTACTEGEGGRGGLDNLLMSVLQTYYNPDSDSNAEGYFNAINHYLQSLAPNQTQYSTGKSRTVLQNRIIFAAPTPSRFRENFDTARVTAHTLPM